MAALRLFTSALDSQPQPTDDLSPRPLFSNQETWTSTEESKHIDNQVKETSKQWGVSSSPWDDTLSGDGTTQSTHHDNNNNNNNNEKFVLTPPPRSRARPMRGSIASSAPTLTDDDDDDDSASSVYSENSSIYQGPAFSATASSMSMSRSSMSSPSDESFEHRMSADLIRGDFPDVVDKEEAELHRFSMRYSTMPPVLMQGFDIGNASGQVKSNLADQRKASLIQKAGQLVKGSGRK